MWKLGILEPAQYLARPQGWGGMRWVSYQLLRTGTPASEQEIARVEAIMRHLQLSSGVYRTTFPGRFGDLDPWISSWLVRHFPANAELLIEDRAASDCLLSAEWARQLSAVFPQSHVTASDLTLHLIEYQTARDSFIVESGGNGLQYIRPPFVINLQRKEPFILPVNAALRFWALRRWKQLRRSVDWMDPWLTSAALTDKPDEGKGFRLKKISVLHPSARQLASAGAVRFTIRRHSVFDPSSPLCHVLRTMNIFNRSYFSAGQLRHGVQAVERSLLLGGIWIVGRTVKDLPPVHEVTIYRKTVAGFERLDRWGAGSEMEPLVETVGRGTPP